MHLTKAHAQENELIDAIYAQMQEHDLIQAIEALPGRWAQESIYLCIIALTALSIAEKARKKREADPMVFFDIGKVPEFMAAAAANSASTNGPDKMLPLLTTYDDRGRISTREFKYKNRRYRIHPIEKAYDTLVNIDKLTPGDHHDYCRSLLDAEGLRYDIAETQAAFAEKKYGYEVPIIVDDSDSRYPITYQAFGGETNIENYRLSVKGEVAAPRLHARVRNSIINRVKDVISDNANLKLMRPTEIALITYANPPMPGTATLAGRVMTINAYVTVQMLDHHLRLTEQRVHLASQGRFTEADIESYEGGIAVQAINDTIEQVMISFATTLTNRGKLANRRVKTKTRLGDNTISVDQVAQVLIMMVAKENPEWARDVIIGKRKHYKFKQAQEYVWMDQSKKHEGRVGFQIKDGRLTVSFRMSQDQYWNSNVLLIPPIPATVGEAITGREASDVVDHPIAQYLGPVKKVASRYQRSAITFTSLYDAIDREALLRQIPEGEEKIAA